MCMREFVGFDDESARTMTSRIRFKIFQASVELKLHCFHNIS